MGDQNNTPQAPQGQPDGGTQPDAQPSQQAPQTPDAGADNQQAGTTQQQAAEPESEPFAVFPTSESFMRRLGQETRRELNRHAEQAGYESWEAMLEAAGSGTQGGPEAAGGETDPEATPEAAPEGEPDPDAGIEAPPPLDEAKRLRMALKVGAEKNLPPALIMRLQGESEDEMAADADTLLGLVGQSNRPSGPGIPPAPRANQQATTFTRAQLRDPKFVREHAEEIQRAADAGRIVDG